MPSRSTTNILSPDDVTQDSVSTDVQSFAEAILGRSLENYFSSTGSSEVRPSARLLFAEALLGKSRPAAAQPSFVMTIEPALGEWLRDVSTLHEGNWDPAKHPRGSSAQNRGWFSTTGGPGGTRSPFSSISDKTPKHRSTDGGTSSLSSAAVDQLPRRVPIRLAQKDRPSIKDDGNSIADRLNVQDDAPAKKPWDDLGAMRWTDDKGGHVTGKIESMSKDGKVITLKLGKPETEVSKKVSSFSADDQILIKGLLAMPGNVALSTEGLAKANQQKWLADVIRDLGRLSELPAGAKLLADIATNHRNGISIKSRDDHDNIGNRVNFTSKPGGASDVVISFSPTDRKGWKVKGDWAKSDRPAFLALGKELWTAERAARFRQMPEKMEEETASGNFENGLRDEYNARIKAGEEKLPHRDLPKH